MVAIFVLFVLLYSVSTLSDNADTIKVSSIFVSTVSTFVVPKIKKIYQTFRKARAKPRSYPPSTITYQSNLIPHKILFIKVTDYVLEQIHNIDRKKLSFQVKCHVVPIVSYLLTCMLNKSRRCSYVPVI